MSTYRQAYCCDSHLFKAHQVCLLRLWLSPPRPRSFTLPLMTKHMQNPTVTSVTATPSTVEVTKTFSVAVAYTAPSGGTISFSAAPPTKASGGSVRPLISSTISCPSTAVSPTSSSTTATVTCTALSAGSYVLTATLTPTTGTAATGSSNTITVVLVRALRMCCPLPLLSLCKLQRAVCSLPLLSHNECLSTTQCCLAGLHFCHIASCRLPPSPLSP